VSSPKQKINNALHIAYKFGGTDGEHHKDWVIDQMVRCLTEEGYNEWVAFACKGEDGPNTYTWNTGTAP